MDYIDACADISPCGLYRWLLLRRWGHSSSTLVWVMLNPSTADGLVDDPTIRRVVGFSRREGYDACVVVNLWALRATCPEDLHAKRSAFEPQNIDAVSHHVIDRDVVVAWGAQAPRGGGAVMRVCIALRKAMSVRCLGVNKDGSPRHPLYVRRDAPLIPWPKPITVIVDDMEGK